MAIEYLPRHTWTGNTVVLQCRHRENSRTRSRAVSLNFDELRIARGGLLETCINESPAPIGYSEAKQLKRVLKRLTLNHDCVVILSTSTSNAFSWQVDSIQAAFENEIESWGSASNSTISSQARYIFRHCHSPLCDGATVSTSGFKSRFNSDTRVRKRLPLADEYDTSFDTEELAEPISALNFENETEADKAALTHLQARLERVLSRCAEIIDEYLIFRQRILTLKHAEPPNTIPARMLEGLKGTGYPNLRNWARLDSDSKLWVAVKLANRDDFHKSYPTRRLKLNGIPALERLTYLPANQAKFEVLLCATYLPRYILVACLIIVQAALIWNKDTALSLTRARIKVTRNRIEVFGIKSKTMRKQDGSITDAKSKFAGPIEELGWSEIQDERACIAIRLLIEHDIAINEYATRDGESVFCSLHLKSTNPLLFRLPEYSEELRAFIKKEQFPAFQFDDIREHASHIYFLNSKRDIFGLSAVMGHAQLATTEEYLNTTIVRVLNAASMKRYMDILAPTIVFTCRGKTAVEALHFDESRISETLLFPLSSMSNESTDTIADKWIASNGSLKIQIGANEIQHCALQMLFYRTNLRRLINDNQLRFKLHHLPRLIFCVALHQFISGSRYSYILEHCEEALNAPQLH